MNRASSVHCLLLLVLAAGLRAEDPPAGSSAKSANWLIDAMGDKADGSGNEAKPVAGKTGQLATSHAPGATSGKGVANPLSSYLESWMSPQDYALLRAREADAHAPGAAAVTEPFAVNLPSVAPSQDSNPYLAKPAPSVSGQAKPPAGVPAPTVARAASAVDQADVAPAKSPSPPADVLKAQEDAKYFPQLKRF